MGVYSFNTTNNNVIQNSSEEQSSDNIIRVYGDDEIKSNIVLDTLSVDDIYSENNVKSRRNYVAINYPLIKINGYVIDYPDIIDFSVKYIDFIPTVYLVINVKANTFLIKNTPKDGDLISIAMRPKNDTYKTIRNDFVITSVNCSGAGDNGLSNQIIVFNGKLFIPNLESENNCFGFIGSSKEAIKKIAKDLNLGFAYNDEEDTTDSQLWLCCKNSIAEYINNVIVHSWKDEISFYKIWIDAYYNLTLINVNKTLLGSEESLDEAVITNTLKMNNIDPADSSILEQKNADVGHKIFSNHQSFAPTTFYISDWKVINNSSDITFKYGTSIISNSFKHNQNIYNNKEENYESISNEPAYDQNKINLDNSINVYQILRGRTSFDSSYNFKDIYISNPWAGIEYVMSDDDSNQLDSTDTWSGNTHKNYNRAEFHNLINNKELDKLYIVITVNGLCTQFLKGEKVPIVLFLPNQGTATNINKSALDDDRAEMMNLFYSGYYFIDGIEYTFIPNEEGNIQESSYKTNFILKRREWPIALPGKITYDSSK